MITGVSVKHYVFCPVILRVEGIGFGERLTEAMREGTEVEAEKVMAFLYPTLKAKEVIRKPYLKYRDLSGVPDYVLRFSYYSSPLDLKDSRRVSLDHKAQVLFYAYLMEMSGTVVKEAFLYYVPLERLIRIPYTYQSREYVERTIREIREIIRGGTGRHLRVTQEAKKCINCGFFYACRPRRQGKFFVREL
ncbi:CRISPR-associated protein Cas4 [Metallosphaera tengchongensis]|uniref:CRISPR-associated exonuclease Cas4 n=1 Tax=Metallosphaera tengchongensis TaxID=1532350 RepID=A0A6N0P0G2_9CREN|nr:CRISPR-associated protein Cas4 [Metallosphaera tengchongensis]QKR00760.1 CRISPR-associated protein Cas4 [Metallosphaera tengchongensis]